MDLREKYKKEKGKWSSVVCSGAEGNTYFTDGYVEWLEEKLVENCSVPDVAQSNRAECTDCGNYGWIYSEDGTSRKTCPCHY